MGFLGILGWGCLRVVYGRVAGMNKFTSRFGEGESFGLYYCLLGRLKERSFREDLREE